MTHRRIWWLERWHLEQVLLLVLIWWLGHQVPHAEPRQPANDKKLAVIFIKVKIKSGRLNFMIRVHFRNFAPFFWALSTFETNDLVFVYLTIVLLRFSPVVKWYALPGKWAIRQLSDGEFKLSQEDSMCRLCTTLDEGKRWSCKSWPSKEIDLSLWEKKSSPPPTTLWLRLLSDELSFIL